MRNIKQVLLGASLLTAAFFVGTYYSGEALKQGSTFSAETLPHDDLVWNSAPLETPSSGSDLPNLNRDAESWGVPPPRRQSLGETNRLPHSQDEVLPSFLRAPGLAPLADSRSEENSLRTGLEDARFGPAFDSATSPNFYPPQGMAQRHDFGSRDDHPAVPALPGSFGVHRPSADLSPLASRSRQQVQWVVDSFQIHVVRPGESLPTIAQQYFGSPDYYLDIYLANQEVLASPAELTVGVSLKIPVYQTRR